MIGGDTSTKQEQHQFFPLLRSLLHIKVILPNTANVHSPLRHTQWRWDVPRRWVRRWVAEKRRKRLPLGGGTLRAFSHCARRSWRQRRTPAAACAAAAWRSGRAASPGPSDWAATRPSPPALAPSRSRPGARCEHLRDPITVRRQPPAAARVRGPVASGQEAL